MDIEKLIEDLRGLLEQYGEKIPYGELVGAPWPYSRAGDLVWPDPEPYFIEQAATALSTLQAENEKLRGYINDLETQHRTEMCENGYDCVELGKLRAELDAYRNRHCAGGGCAAEKDRDAVLAELEQVKRERDAIEQDFRAFTKQWWEEANGFPCRFCKFEHFGGCEQKAKHPDDEKPCVGRWFEWRGPKEG